MSRNRRRLWITSWHSRVVRLRYGGSPQAIAEQLAASFLNSSESNSAELSSFESNSTEYRCQGWTISTTSPTARCPGQEAKRPDLIASPRSEITRRRDRTCCCSGFDAACAMDLRLMRTNCATSRPITTNCTSTCLGSSSVRHQHGATGQFLSSPGGLDLSEPDPRVGSIHSRAHVSAFFRSGTSSMSI